MVETILGHTRSLAEIKELNQYRQTLTRKQPTSFYYKEATVIKRMFSCLTIFMFRSDSH